MTILTGVMATSSVYAQSVEGLRPPPAGQTLQAAASAQAATAPPTIGKTDAPFSGKLAFREALARGLEFNLTAISRTNALTRARADERIAKSVLLPNVSGTLLDAVQRVNLAALGFRFDVPFPGFVIPETVGPFNVVDLRARASMTVLDRAALHNYRASQENVAAAQESIRDVGTVIVVAVGRAYLEAVAARARVEAVRAQVETARTLLQRATLQRTAGLATPIDLNRAQLQTLSQEQRLFALQADAARWKIDLARLTGLTPTDQYDLTDELSFFAPPPQRVEDAIREAVERRSDLKVAEAQVRAAERTLEASMAQKLPTVSVSADFGASYANPVPVQATYTVVGSVRVPIWEGRRTDAETERARAALAQRRAERDDLRAQIEAEVRKAFLDVEAASGQVQVAERNIQVSRDILAQTRQRFDSGVSDNVNVVQAQESVATGEADYINGLLAHNLAKLGLARAIGTAPEELAQFVRPR